MIRMLTAAAMVAMLAAPAMAQSGTSSGGAYGGSSSMDQPGTSQQMPSSPGASGGWEQSPQSSQVPLDCLPNDARPECQTAQIPSEEEGSLDIQEEPQQGSVPETTDSETMDQRQMPSVNPDTETR